MCAVKRLHASPFTGASDNQSLTRTRALLVVFASVSRTLPNGNCHTPLNNGFVR